MEGLRYTLEGYLGASSPLAFPLAFAGGFLISFTPCVYPVIPIVVTTIGAQAKGSKRRGFILSLFYVLGMAITYSALGAFAALTGRIFGQIQSNPVAHLVVGLIIIAFGLAMLGVYPLPLPGFLSGRRTHRGGMAGTLVMGLASGFVVAPCTAAILGVLLTFVAKGQDVLYGVVLLFSFALGMGVLLVAIGTFAGLVASLPRPGRWMERIEHVFGGLTVALGLYFVIQAIRMWT